MTDNEILESAALAVGKEISFGPDGILYRNKGEQYWKGWWNPRENSGDALELAAMLRLKIEPGKYLGDGCTVYASPAWNDVASCTAFRDNAVDQMRVAILRVAAEIGKVAYRYKPKKEES